MGETPRKKSLDSHTEIKSTEVTQLWLQHMESKTDIVCQKLNEILKLIPRIDRWDMNSAAALLSKYLRKVGANANSSITKQMEEKMLTALNIALEIKNDLVLHPLVTKKSDTVSQIDLESLEKTPSKQKKKFLKYFEKLNSQKIQRKAIKATPAPTRIIISSQTNQECSIKAIVTPNKVSLKAVVKTEPENLFCSCHRVPRTVTNEQNKLKPQIRPTKVSVNDSSFSLSSKIGEPPGQRISTRSQTKENQSSSVKSKLRNEKSNPVASKVKSGQKSRDDSQKPPWR